MTNFLYPGHALLVAMVFIGYIEFCIAVLFPKKEPPKVERDVPVYSYGELR